MNIYFSKKLLSLIILGLLSPTTVYAIDKKECNSTDTLQGWGIWCGIDTYLSQQEPTAAGPVDGSNSALGLPAIDGDEFGGSVVVPNEVNEEASYNWRGYAILRVQVEMDNNPVEQQPARRTVQQYKYLTGVLNINHDPDNDNILAVMNLEDGSTVTFNKDASFTAPAWDNSYFKITSEDESLTVVSSVLPTLFGGSQLPDALNNENVTSGYFTTPDDSSFPYESKFVAGSLTSADYINELALNNITATYSGYGMYKGDKSGTRYNQITVNFGNSSWDGYWKLDGSRIFAPDSKLQASGVVTGNQFSSTENSLNYQTYENQGSFFRPNWVENNQAATGSINGSFNGAEAKNLTGLVDVNIDGKRTVGVFANEMDSSIANLPQTNR